MAITWARRGTECRVEKGEQGSGFQGRPSEGGVLTKGRGDGEEEQKSSREGNGGSHEKKKHPVLHEKKKKKTKKKKKKKTFREKGEVFLTGKMTERDLRAEVAHNRHIDGNVVGYGLPPEGERRK